eukprot:CAMPEP_0183714198 /NCGR_PEP_ID=MMETSP0737-20130205/8813_1 /TAXON_ID=385413 /ORGANISM="Thalassiosira miniscula, Strain CCMP1093" /LENGTH=680 /DNA_ID=CAMNT_0025943105 /DNA_START=35 /DNA_END=2077 /DNA_ORIENTATION=-
MASAQPDHQRWRIVFRRVAVRDGPSTKHSIIGVKYAGDTVRAIRNSSDGLWIALSRDDKPSCCPATVTAWMLVDGTSVGLGTLLEPCLPVPRLLFAGSRAILVEWDAMESTAAADWLAEPPQLLRRSSEDDGTSKRQPLSFWGQNVDWKALRPDKVEVQSNGAPSKTCYQLRIGGLAPITRLALCLSGRSTNADGHECYSPWLEVETRPERMLALNGTPGTLIPGQDAMGRMLGRLSEAEENDASRDDCPHGFWIPSEFFAGGQNSSTKYFPYWCGDCGLRPIAHEKVQGGPDKTLRTGSESNKRSPCEEVSSGGDKSGENTQFQSYLEKFRSWDESKPSWRKLYAEKEIADPTETIYSTSDLHIDFADNEDWLEALQPHTESTLIVAGDISHSIEDLEYAFEHLVSLYKHVFYVPGNHELWIHKEQGNSVDKFLRILQLADDYGVHTRPAWVAEGVCIIPLFSWYNKTLFGKDADRETLSNLEKRFDQRCSWPPSIGLGSDPHNSLHKDIARFFLACNESRFARQDWPRELLSSSVEEKTTATEGGPGLIKQTKPVVLSFSHFIPRSECFQGYSNIQKIMGCQELDVQIRTDCGSAVHKKVHVFGHSHLPVDITMSGVRYFQQALGYPRDWGGNRDPPKELWSLYTGCTHDGDDDNIPEDYYTLLRNRRSTCLFVSDED